MSGNPTLEEVCLLVLNLNVERYKAMQNVEAKREFIRDLIASSSPSFGRFMTQVYDRYDRGLKNGVKKGSSSQEESKHILRKIKELVKKDSLSSEEVLEICLDAYKYSRAAKL